MFDFSVSKDKGELEAYLQKITDDHIFDVLDAYGEKGVATLREATPTDSGRTGNSWSYRKVKTDRGYVLEFNNSHINDGVKIAVILQYGHGTGTGGYVQGRDYINPATKMVFDQIANELTKEIQ